VEEEEEAKTADKGEEPSEAAAGEEAPSRVVEEVRMFIGMFTQRSLKLP
jgi:hypothetical protein